MSFQNRPQNPTNAQIAAREGVSQVVVTQQHGYYDNEYLWAMGLTEEAIDRVIAFNSLDEDGEDFLHCLTKYWGSGSMRFIPVAAEEYGWREYGRFWHGLVINSVIGAVGAATIEVEDSVTIQRFQVNDVLRGVTNGGWNAKVTGVDLVSGPNPRYELTKVGSPTPVWAAGDLNATDTLGYITNAWAEGTGQPIGFEHTPITYTNRLSLVKSGTSYTGDALTTKHTLELPNGYGSAYMHFNWWIEILRHKKRVENTLFWGQHSGQASGQGQSTNGFFNEIKDAAQAPVTYTGSPSEANLFSALSGMDRLNPGNHYLLLMGETMAYDLVTVLKDYQMDGAVHFGDFNQPGGLPSGLGITSYSIPVLDGKKISFKRYKPFSDRKTVGYAGAPSATTWDMSQVGLMLNMGNAPMAKNGQSDNDLAYLNTMGPTAFSGKIPYFSVMAKQLDGVDRSMVFGYQAGMTGRAGSQGMGGAFGSVSEPQFSSIPKVATDVDADKLFILSQVGARVVSAGTAHTYMRAIG